MPRIELSQQHPAPVPQVPLATDTDRRVCPRPGCGASVPRWMLLAIFVESIARARGAQSMDRMQDTQNEVVATQGALPGCQENAQAVFVVRIAPASDTWLMRFGRVAPLLIVSPQNPECLVGACSTHCHHRQCSHAADTGRWNSRSSRNQTNLQPFR